jgi:hypothetical protein
LLDELSHEHDDTLCAICVLFGKVDFVAKHYEPAMCTETLDWLQYHVLSSAHVGAILGKSLQNDIWSGSA